MKLMVMNNDNGRIVTRLMADSTTLRSGQPFFVPDHAPRFAVTPMLALRVGRLGKCIAPRFAHRYIDAVTAAFIVTPTDLDGNPLDLDGMAAVTDGTAMMGARTTVNAQQPLPAMTWSHNDCEHTLDTASLCPTPAQAIEHISRYCTLKMGDIVCLSPLGTRPVPIAIDDHLTASVGGKQVLTNKIK